jgi:hypothetical protein
MAYYMRWLKSPMRPAIRKRYRRHFSDTMVPAPVLGSKKTTEALPGEVDTLGLVPKGVQILQHSLDGKCRETHARLTSGPLAVSLVSSARDHYPGPDEAYVRGWV